MFDFDPRDRDDDVRDVEMPWIELRHEPGRDREPDDARDRGDGRDRDRDTRERDHDPREVFLEGLELPRGLEREIVMDGDRRYELNGDDSRSLGAVGAFRVVAERDLRDRRDESADPREPDLRHLRHEGLVRSVALDGRERALTLTTRGHHLLSAHRRDRDETRAQAFYAGVSRPRELSHDVQLYRAYLREEERLRDPGEIERWAREHDLPYFDDRVRFPDFRIEYELDRRDRHEDVEVVTEHYRGAHAASVARAGFRCYGRGGGSGRSGGRGFDPRVAEEFV